MTITVGTDTYVSLSDSYDYHQNHGNSSWTDYRKTIIGIVTDSDGIEVETSSAHGYSTDDRVSLYDTTNYNQVGNVITVVDTTHYTLDLDYVEDETEGYCVNELLEICLRKATEWIDNHPEHKGNWVGSLYDSDQLLSFPRSGIVDEEGRDLSDTDIPDVIEKSCCEMSLKALTETIFPDIGQGSSGLKRMRVDVIEKEWFSPSSSNSRKKYDYVDNLLSGLLINYGSMMILGRGY